MNESDDRKLDRKALEAIRTRAVKRVEAGESPETVIKLLASSEPRYMNGLPNTVKEVLKPFIVVKHQAKSLNLMANSSRSFIEV